MGAIGFNDGHCRRIDRPGGSNYQALGLCITLDVQQAALENVDVGDVEAKNRSAFDPKLPVTKTG